MTDIDSADLQQEPGDSDRGEDPTISDGVVRLRIRQYRDTVRPLV